MNDLLRCFHQRMGNGYRRRRLWWLSVLCLVPLGCAISGSGKAWSAPRERSVVTSATIDFAALIAAAADGQWREAAALLTALQERWQHYSPEQRAFLLGLAKLELGHDLEARDQFATIREQYPLLKDYILFFFGEAALGAGDTPAAAAAFHAVSAMPGSRWSRLARERLGAVAMAESRWDDAQALFEEISRNQKDAAGRWRAQLQLAELAVRRGDAATASTIYLTLYHQATGPTELVQVHAGLQLLRERLHRDLLGKLSSEERLELAREFLSRELPDEAAALLTTGGKVSESPEVREVLGQAEFKARHYPEAAGHLCALADHGGFALDRQALLRLCATALARAGRVDEAIQRNQQIMTETRGSPTASVAQYKIAFLLMDNGQYTKAIPAYRAWLDGTPRSGASPDVAQWAIVWCHYRLGEWNAALEALEEMADGHRKGRARLVYWRARILEAAGKKGEARSLYNDLVSTGGADPYYGGLARHRMRATDPSPLFYHQPSMAHAARDAASSTSMRSVAAQELAHLGLLSFALHEESMRTPLTYRAVVELVCHQWQMDPNLVYAVMQRESHFRSDAVSRSGAVGLMQLMPATGGRLAQELHWRDFQDRDLYQPTRNAELGIWYLHTLLSRFHGALPMALAAYNAGEEAVDRWIELYWQRRTPARKQRPPMPREEFAKAREEPAVPVRASHGVGGAGAGPPMQIDEFVEEIPYDETNAYVKSILAQYWSTRK